MKSLTQMMKLLTGLVLCGWLTSTATAITNTWDASGIGNVTDGDGTWSTGAANWWNGAADIAWPNGVSDAAIIGNGNGAAGTITVSGSLNVNAIIFNAASSGNYIVTNGTLTLSGTTPTITANSDATIKSALAGSAGLIKNGAGILTLASPAISYTGDTIVNAGTLSLNAAQNIGGAGFAIAPTAAAGAMVIDGGAVTKTGAGDYFIVGYNTGNGLGTLTVTNNGYLSVGALRVNWSGAAGGIVNLSSGTISIGSSPTPSAIGSGGTATWNQSGGNASFAGQLIVGWTTSAGVPVTVNLSGGTFTAATGDVLNFGSGGTTTWNQTGGTAGFGTSGVRLGVGSGPTTMTISGGTNSTAGAFYLGAYGGGGLGTLTVTNTGFVSIQTLQLGFGTTASKGLLNLDGGTLQIGSGGISYGGSGSGTISFNGGTLLASNNLSIANNTNLHTIVNDGGAAFNTSNFTLTVSTPLTVGSGSGGLTKSGSGMLTLGGTNTYIGTTRIQAGTLVLQNVNSLGSGSLFLTNGVSVQLNYSGTSTVAALSFDGGNTMAAGGTWGSTGSGAEHINNTIFSGTGLIAVIPEPSSLLLVGLGLISLVLFTGRRRLSRHKRSCKLATYL